MSAPPRVGWLFAYDWDRAALQRLGSDGRVRVDHAGFDLFAFPSNLGLAVYDHERFARRQIGRGRRFGWRAVISHQEHFGALAASLVAEALRLPGTAPEAILAAKHKLHARRVLQRVAPEACPRFEELKMDYGDPAPDGLAYPRFAKPIKAVFSVLARQVDDREALHAHTRFGRRELWVIRRLVDPFDRLCRSRLAEAGTAHRIFLEEVIPAEVAQFNLAGWVVGGQVRALGIVGAVMYPGTRAFMRWEYPAQLPEAVGQRALDVARRFLAAIGFRHGLFNLEFFYDSRRDRLTVIECNPRLAAQFGDLYRRVRGADPHVMGLALGLGDDPEEALSCSMPSAGIAASLVYRAFRPRDVPLASSPAQRAAFARRFPDGLLYSFPKRGYALARDLKWTGNHHYGFIHLGARDRRELLDHAREASRLVGWPAPCLDDEGAPGPSGPAPMQPPASRRRRWIPQARARAPHLLPPP